GRLEDLRVLLAIVRNMRRVAVTVGLVESILLRAGCHRSLGSEGALDAAVCNSLVSLLAGERSLLEQLLDICGRNRFPELARMIKTVVVAEQPVMAIELDPIL